MEAENAEPETDWIAGTALRDIGYVFEQEPESVPGYIPTKEHRLMRSIAVLMSQYGWQVRNHKIEYSWQPQNKQLQRQIAVFSGRCDFLSALLDSFDGEDDNFFRSGIFPDLSNQQKVAVPAWMQGSVFEEIGVAYGENLSVAIAGSLPPGVIWKYFGKLSRLMNAAYYVADRYRDEIKKMETDAVSMWGAVRKRRLLGKRLAVAHAFFCSLVREEVVSSPGNISWAIAEGDKIFATEDREGIMRLMEGRCADE